MSDETDKKGSPRIVVAGDVTIDWFQWMASQGDGSGECANKNWALYPGTRMSAEAGGALLLARMVEAATSSSVATHKLSRIDSIPPEKTLHSISVLDMFPVNGAGGDKVFRISRYGGFAGPTGGTLKPLPVVNDLADADLVVIDDAGNGFRDIPGVWPKAITDPGKSPLIILKMSRPIASGVLWEHLQKHHHDHLIVVISANDLREMGVSISQRLSWERTAEDFAWQMANNPIIKSLAACRTLLVRFGLDGAIHYANDRGHVSARLFYDPAYLEDGFKEQHKGDMQGITSAFVAGLSSVIAREGIEGTGKGILAGLFKSRQLFLSGFGKSGEVPSYPVSKVFGPTADKVSPISEVAIPPLQENAAGHKKPWTILEEYTRGKMEVVSYDAVLKRSEGSLKHVPSARFGGLFTLDRNEIESYQSIRNLLAEYLGKKDSKVPLSIAVFGPPGSGKSFGVTQLALTLDPERVVKMEFNVAQFTSVDDLTHAFHRVRDMVLEGKVPLVFFDEFDSAFGGELGWLKYFLAPMQDGAFKEGETMHPVGKSIFVFAGGTSYTFQQFSRESPDGHLRYDEMNAMLKTFRDAKGTDFISRLRGYVNVLGPNRSGDGDVFYVIRRALLLRSLLKRKAPQIFDDRDNARIDPGVLRAFLKVPAYKHGARSMEAIIDMSMLSGRRKFEQAALPSAKQLELHVGADIFSKLVLRDVLFEDAMERLAKVIHEQYLIDQKGIKKPDDLAMQPWAALNEEYRESSRQQAGQIPEKLHRIGLDFMPFIDRPATQLVFTNEQVEILGEMEHERWMSERLKEGWVSGSPRDPVKKISPYLVPWSELDEEVKEWDRNPVRRIPKLLEIAGFEIYPMQ